MKTKYLQICTLLLFCYIGHAQDSNITVSAMPMSNLNIVSSANNSTNFEFVPLSEKTRLSIDLYDFSESTEANLPERILVDTLKNNTKIYISIEQNLNDIIIKCTQIEIYILTYPVKAKFDKKINIHEFRPRPNTQNNIVPIILLMDKKDEHNPNIMNAMSRVLNCPRLEDIKKSDIEFLKEMSVILKVLTYKMESAE